MSEVINDEGHLRKYLLGELEEAEQQALEERLLTEDELFGLLPVAEEELIDDYLGGTLSEDERGRFESYFLSTPDRRRQLSFAMALRRYFTADEATEVPRVVASQRSRPRPSSDIARPSMRWNQLFSSPYLRMVATAAIVLGLGLGIWRAFFYQSEVEKGVVALARAYRAERPVEARISGLGYAPFVVTRGTGPEKVDSVSLNRAERILFDEAAERPSTESHHALGRLYFAEQRFSDAIKEFEEALNADASNARLQCDYGALLLERGKAEQSKDESSKALETFARSLEHLSKAIELNGSLLDALFNRALLYQHMMLPQQAEDEWRKYLERDPGSRWADEARQNLKHLEEVKQKRGQSKEVLLDDFLRAYRSLDDERAWKIASQNREALSGKLIFEQLLNHYLDEKRSGLGDADGRLQALSYVAKLDAERSGDRYVADLDQFYRSASKTQRLALTQARELLSSGHRHYVLSRLDAAIDSYSKARNLFYQAGDSQEATYAEYWMGLCYLETARVQQSSQVLLRLEKACEQRKHQWLLAQVLNSLGNLQTILKEYSKATEYTSRALEIAEKTQDTYGQQKHLAQLASEYRDMGNYRQALAFLHQGLTLAEASGSGSRQMWRNYDTTARTFTLMGEYVAAAAYGKEALLVALEAQDPGLMYVSYVHLGVVYGKLQDYAEAIRHAEHGFQIAQSFSNEPAGLDMLAYSSLQLGHLNREGLQFNDAIVHYDRAIQLSHDLNYQVWLYEAHKGKLLCGIAQKNDALAEAELQPTLSLFHQYRARVQEESNRNAFLNDQQNIFDVAIDFAYSRLNDAQRALQYAESGRARSLLDLTGSNAQLIHRHHNPELLLQFDSKPLSLTHIQSRMPPETQVLEYAVLNDKLLIWVFSRTVFSVTKVDISIDQLSKEVLGFLQLVSRPDEGNLADLVRAAEGLYDILIHPLEPVLDQQKLLCIIPDKVLNYLPFGALVSPVSGRYLADHYLTESSPSANIFLVCTKTAREREGEIVESVLSVGNPRFDSSAFPTLSELPSSRREAEAVAASYASSCLLVGVDAREARIKSEMERNHVIHLASHYVVDEQAPMLSKLILAKEKTESEDRNAPDGVLQAYEIYGLKLPRARLVVLSACQTGVEKYYNGEGMIGMSRTFIAASVPLVIASLWAVDSASSTELMINFHRYRKQQGLSTVEAFRKAQMDMATGLEPRYRHPYYWASFIAIGGYARF